MTVSFAHKLLPLLLLIALLSCKEQPQKEIVQGPLIEVGQRQLSLDQFDRELLLNYPDISGLPEDQQIQIKAQLIKQLIDRELILGEAARLNVQLSPDELDAALTDIRGSYSDDEFDQVLKKTGKTFEAWIATLKLRLLTEKVSKAILAPQVEVSDSEAEDFYRRHKEDFHRPTEIRARQMLFPTREEALDVLKRFKGGEKFADLARQFSHSPDSEKGGSLGYFSRGQMPEEFDRVLFNLPVRQVSDPVESPYGFHLFYVERRRRAGLRPYAAVKEEIFAKLYQQKEEKAFHSWLEDLQKTTRATVNWELLTPSHPDNR